VGTNAGIDPSVGVFIDGVYQGRAGMSVSDLLDIERIEVLRGPQGTLYGKNTAAGAINIITASPTEDASAFAETVIGNYNLMEFRGSVNGPIVEDKLAGRVAGYKVTRAGYDVNYLNGDRVNDADKWGVRGKLRWLGTEHLDIVLVGDYSVDQSSCCVGDIRSFDGPPTIGVTFEDLAAETGIPLPPVDPFDRVVGVNVPPINDVSVGGIALDTNLEVGVYDFRWLTSYRNYKSDSQFDGDFSVYDAVTSEASVDFNQVSSEILMVSPGGETIEWQGGTYFFYSNLETDDKLGYSQLVAEVSPVLSDPAENINLNQHRTFNWAAFGQGTWNAAEKWSFTGGFRVDFEKKTREGLSLSTCLLPVPPVCGLPDPRNEERHVWNPQGTVIARYRPTDDVMIYASFANGFKSGGFNQLRTSESLAGPLKSEFDDELSFNYELGGKTTWFDGTLLANLTGYFTDYRDFQAQIFDGSSIVVDNAGRLFSWGLESELRWVPEFVPDRGFVLGAALGLNFTQYKQFDNAPATVPQQNEIVSASPPPGYTPGTSAVACILPAYDCSQDLTGRRLDNAPRISLSLFASYERKLPGFPLVWFSQGDYLIETFKYLDTDLDSNEIQDPINLLGFRTGLKTEDDMIELSFWVANTLNQGWFVAGSDVPIVNGYWGVNAPPRTYGGTVRFRF
jgi:iron complex outermembrane receptor protein